MKDRWTMKRGIASALLLAACGVLVTGCSSGTDSTNTAPAGASEIPASSETRQALGVEHWSQRQGAGDTVIEGTDDSGNVRVRFEQVATTDAAGAMHATITADVGGSSKMQYVVSADGQGRIERNDFPSSLQAVEAARVALADFQGSTRSLVQTKSLRPTNLAQSGVPLIQSGACMNLIAVACIVAASCGLGGSAGAEVLAGVAEAGTEQCR
jgi:hypothetical protein